MAVCTDCTRVLIFTGLPQHERSQLDNIHFLCCSNKVDTLEMAAPLVANLKKLEEGVVMYDASLHQAVLVIAPVLMIIGDNPMCSDLCNHLGSAARKYCRMCMVSLNICILYTCLHISNQVDKTSTPESLGSSRSKKQSVRQMSHIANADSKLAKQELCTKYGLSDSHNPLFQLNVDLFK